MAIFRGIVFAAACAGLVAGILVTVLQHLGTVPLILQAEVYEKGAEATPVAAEPGPTPDAHRHDAEEAWQPGDGIERTAFTLMANTVTGVGFGLLLVAALAIGGRRLDWRQGLLAGLAGFVIFTLAPSIGLPPELPGIPPAPLTQRQVWWVATALATATGIGLLVYRRSPLAAVLAIALLVAPHLVGAPEAPEAATAVPEALRHRFEVAVMVTSFLFWACLGVLGAVFYQHFRADREVTASIRASSA